MDTQAILTAYNEIAQSNELPRMEPGGYQLHTESFDDPDRLWQRLLEHIPTQGWLLFQSWQGAFDSGLPTPEDSWGLLLAAETVDAAGESFSVAQDGRGGWILSHCRHDPEATTLWDEVQHLTHDGKALRYRRYWRHDPEQGYLQDRACFIGYK